MRKPKKVLILGSGGLKIGQAGEFDYSGSQAIKALKEEKIDVVLMNPNIATVQTDKGLADKVYFVPLTLDFATDVIEKEKPDAILLGFGGQTALNLGLLLEDKGILKKYAVRVLGTPVASIRDTEDRDLFVQRLNEIHVNVARSHAAKNMDEALAAADDIGYPVMVRSGFALGGEGSGMVRSKTELSEKLPAVFRASPQVLIEEYLGGWKEIEYEVVRDANDNCITVCNMENVDPMGVHTGESIVVAPSQTLSNSEYHFLREVALKTIRHLKIVGECNIQYAVNPRPNDRLVGRAKNGLTGKVDYRVIEVNARLSRSSALASKATGYPLAFVAAKLALGYALTDLKNTVTKKTTACFEPSLDYLVMKIPRWDLTKFENAAPRIGTEMKSVGEVMAIGRSFEEVLQKALRMIMIGADGFTAHSNRNHRIKEYLKEIKEPTTRRIFAIAEALEKGTSVKKIQQLSGIDPWFLEKMKHITDFKKKVKASKRSPQLIREAKKLGFSDKQIGTMIHAKEEEVRKYRIKNNIRPFVKQIDTLAGEFPAQTNYLYLTYHGTEHDIKPGRKSMIVLGSGPYSIGSSVEFDWSCVQALSTLKKEKYETVVVNYNPETVSTDYDMSDRLYFDELSLERVLDITDFEKPKGVVVSTGGQIPNNLALPLSKAHVPILGTHPKNIDQAEDRNVFSALLDRLEIDQPEWTEASSSDDAARVAKKFGYPVLIRPSYVLSGSAMSVAFNEVSLKKYLERAATVSSDRPVVVSKFIENAREIEIDGVAKEGTLVVYAITEHVENAGTHSGDATVVLPPQRTYLETIRRAKHITKAILKELSVTGPFNIQFLAKENNLQVIELNVRASRSFPFVSKVSGYNFAHIATEALLGKDMSKNFQTLDMDYVAVKSPQFSHSRIKGADPLLYVEMASTGEVASFGDSYHEALLKSMLSAGFTFPKKNVLVSVGGEENKIKLLPALEKLSQLGFSLFGTEGTTDFLVSHKVPCTKVYKIKEQGDPNILAVIDDGTIDFIINIPMRPLARDIEDGFIIRRRAVDLGIPLITNRQLAESFVAAFADYVKNPRMLKAKSWDDYKPNS